jgi:hypothetical protein
MTAQGPKRHRIPTGLEASGKALWYAMTADFDAEPWEIAILTAAARQADDVARLERLIVRDGATVLGSAGQARLHPAISELRQGRLAVGKLLAQLHLVDEPETGMGRSPRSRRASHAANTRWGRVTRMEDHRRSADA